MKLTKKSALKFIALPSILISFISIFIILISGTYSNVYAAKCGWTQHIENWKCVNNKKTCYIQNWLWEKTWSKGTRWACIFKGCRSNLYEISNNVCILKKNIVNNKLVTCKPSQHFENGGCVDNTKTCYILNWLWKKTWSKGTRWACIFKSCRSNLYEMSNNGCILKKTYDDWYNYGYKPNLNSNQNTNSNKINPDSHDYDKIFSIDGEGHKTQISSINGNNPMWYIIEKNNKYWYLDKNKKQIIATKYDDIQVYSIRWDKNIWYKVLLIVGKWNYIYDGENYLVWLFDNNWIQLLPVEYKTISSNRTYWDDYNKRSNNLTEIKKNWFVWLIDEDGNIIIPAERYTMIRTIWKNTTDSSDYLEVNKKRFIAWINNKWWLIDNNQNVIIQLEYDSYEILWTKLISFRLSNKTWLYDISWNMILPIEYDSISMSYNSQTKEYYIIAKNYNSWTEQKIDINWNFIN